MDEADLELISCLLNVIYLVVRHLCLLVSLQSVLIHCDITDVPPVTDVASLHSASLGVARRAAVT